MANLKYESRNTKQYLNPNVLNFKHFFIYNFFRISDFGFRIYKCRGFSIIEVLVYIAIFVTVMAMVVGTGLALSRSYRGVANTASIERDGIAILEKISREARGAVSVDTGASVLGVNPGVLALNATDPSGAARSVKFLISNSTMHFFENSSDKGALNSNKTSVSNFIARKIATGKSEAVKIEVALQSYDGKATTTKNFYSTIILRNSY
jgi:type II secretory pathway pseudopilin PulG